MVSEKSRCSKAAVLQLFMESHGSDWKTVLAYAPMENGREERMVGIVKLIVARLVGEAGSNWDQVFIKSVHEYRHQ